VTIELSVDFSGAEGLRETLRALSDEDATLAFRKGLGRGARVIADKATANMAALDDSGTKESMAKNVNVRFSTRRFKSTGDIMWRIGMIGGARQYVDNSDNRKKGRVGGDYDGGGDSGAPGGDTFYWRFHEFGAKNVRESKPMRNAMEAGAQPALNEFFQGAREAIEKIIARNARRAAKGAR
jgi:HK97 gp10 family phage protein